MDRDSDSSIELLDSSVCHVCRSLGDMSSPRGALLDVEGELVEVLGRYHYIYMHHPSIAALVRSAEGCSICTMLCHELRGSDTTKFDQAADAVSLAPTTASTHAKSDDEIATCLAELVKSKNSDQVLDSTDFGRGRIIISHCPNGELGLRGNTGRFLIQAFVVQTNSLRVFLSGFRTSYDQFDPDLKHRPSMHLLSDPHIGLIRDWRDNCEKKHASCRTTACDQQLPRRVLELDPNKEDGARLIETHGMKGKYACLSYCWGVSKTQAGQTKRSNLSNHLQGIVINNLPNTIVETIHLCNKLGFRYLWVDRLCIIQDDTEDWAREASKMCDIYSRSDLTISAPICSESSQSPQQQRHKWWFLKQSQFGSMEFTDERSNLKSSLWLHHQFLKQGPWTFEGGWKFRELSSDESHWLRRGWTFQEWMLSPRVLHIDSMTIWDCFNGYANELNQRDMREAHLIRDPREFGRGISWKTVIEEYSRRGLAYERDRLPALAGLAERYRQETGYTYLAGMWLEEMPSSLIWWDASGSYNSTDRRELASQTTPSWSWAHCNGPVWFHFDDEGLSAKASIESYHCLYEPPSSISTVVEAWIDVDGYLGDVTGTRQNGLLVGNEWRESYLDNGDWDTDDAAKQGNVKLLLLISTKKTGRDDSLKSAALVLQRCGSNDVSPLRFRRLGIAHLSWSESKGPVQEPLWKKQVVRLV